MPDKSGPLSDPALYINRELSWLEFNDRVLRQGLDDRLPLLERLKFLAIVGSNLDEFFMVRVAGLMQQRAAGLRKRDPSGMTPAAQLRAIAQRTQRMVQEQYQGIGEVLEALAEKGLALHRPDAWSAEQRQFIRSHFDVEIQPVLTPLAMEELDPQPLLRTGQLHLALLLDTHPGEKTEGDDVLRVAVVPVPTQMPRFLTLPGEEGTHLATLEDAIAYRANSLFPGCRVRAKCFFRITRDADVAIQEDEAGDLLQAVERAVTDRRRQQAVRLEIGARPDRRIKRWLVDTLELRKDDVYEVAGPLDTAALMELVSRPGYDDLRTPDWPAQSPRDLVGADDLRAALEDRDVLLFHPYESFSPVVDLVDQAADDPQVLAIKMTLYRTSGDSPIVKALERAAGNGVQVTVLVELKARFDEARNVGWARRLEDAGCHVIYGIAGYKTHAKALLIVRRDPPRIARYVHLATGNYNDKTAKLYSDMGLMTTDREIASDVAAFFNLLTGYSEDVGFSKLSIAPTGLRRRFEELIDREIQASTPDQPGLIMAKVNSLQDPGICRALYRASQAGVRIRLNVRGICCLRPGVKGVSDTIEVTSIVDRFLEHARVYYFRNGGHEEVYLASADWMTRNIDKRLEILFPVTQPKLIRRIVSIMETYMADNVNAYRLGSDGGYQRRPLKGTPIRAQGLFYQEAVKAAGAGGEAVVRFRPLSRPDNE